jgi:chemotaxis protein histidine kinase CheA
MTPDETLRAAMAAIEDEFLASASRELDLLRQALDALRSDPNRFDEHLDRVGALAHDLKGQCGAFGFEVLGSAAESLHAYVRNGACAAAAEIVEAHIETLADFFDARIRGPGGAAEAAKLDRLAASIRNREAVA